MKLIEIIDTFRKLADDSVGIEGFYTGLASEHNDSVIQYPAMRVSFPYSVSAQRDSEDNNLTYSFKISLLVNKVDNVVNGTLDVGSSYEVNTNFSTQDDALNEIDVTLVDEALLREKALKTMMHYAEGLRQIENENGYFTIDNLSINSLERYANDMVTGVELSISITTFNDYKCESRANYNYSVWKDANHSLIDMNYDNAQVPAYTNLYAMSFDGINERLIAPHSELVNFERTDPWSTSFDVTVRDSLYGFIISQSPAVSVTSGWAVYHIGRKIYVYLANNSTNRVMIRTVGSLTLNQLTHVTVTYNGNSSWTGFTVYFDGVAQTNVSMGSTVTLSTKTTASLVAGHGSGGSLFYANMILDDVKIWDKEFTPTEVTDDIASGPLNPPILSGNLLMYCKMGDDAEFTGGTWYLPNGIGSDEFYSVNMDITNRVLV